MQKGALSAARARLGPRNKVTAGARSVREKLRPPLRAARAWQSRAGPHLGVSDGSGPLPAHGNWGLPRSRRAPGCGGLSPCQGGAARQGRHMRVPVTPDAPFDAIIPGRDQLREGHGIRSQWAPRAGATGFWAGSGAQVRAAGLRRSRAFRWGRSECRVGPARRFSGSCSLTADVGFPQQHRGLADRVRGVWVLSPRRTYLSPWE